MVASPMVWTTSPCWLTCGSVSSVACDPFLNCAAALPAKIPIPNKTVIPHRHTVHMDTSSFLLNNATQTSALEPPDNTPRCHRRPIYTSVSTLECKIRSPICSVTPLALSSLVLGRMRMLLRFQGKWPFLLYLLGLPLFSLHAQQYDQKLFSEMRWRCIGPFRGGRTVAITRVPHQPSVFYMAAVNGGVWKTDDFGNTWNPIFDGQPTGSVGALAVAPSNPNIIYAGSGEGLQRPDLAVGDGIYKSTDAGKTWTHLGLRDAEQITAIVVDPKNPDRVFVAAEGHPYGPNAERGVFRSLDGGKIFEKVLYKDENTGAADVMMDPANPQILFAALWAARVAPWEVRSGESFTIPGSGLYPCTGGGWTWKPLPKGQPSAEDGLARIGIAIAPSNSKRMFLSVE